MASIGSTTKLHPDFGTFWAGAPIGIPFVHVGAADGCRFRMKAGFSCATFSTEVKVICAALKAYGMIVADNGSNWYLSGQHDPRWDDDALGDLKLIPGSVFEAVQTGTVLYNP